MPEHLRTDIIPPGLKKRWEEFAELSKACWEKVNVLELPAAEAFPKFWACMSGKGAHLMSVTEAKKYNVRPHPISVIAKMAKGLTRKQAEKQAIEEGKFSFISLMQAEVEMCKQQGKL